MDHWSQVDAAYFDFKKAFDLVDNDVLLQKLAGFGFTPKLIIFFADYLRGRSQYVALSGYQSQPYYTRSGVSQGSTLGPTLFLLMINDLPKVVRNSRCLLFADDLKLFLQIGERDDCAKLQKDIEAVVDWSDANKLQFNASKCKTVTFTRARSPVYAAYHLRDVPLERVSEISDLGLKLDVELDFRTHITQTCKAATKTLGFIMRVSAQFKNIRVAILLYNAYVRSKLEFGAIAWDPREEKYQLMVERVQRRFARYLYKRQYGYYPLLYPSLFVSGMVGLHTLELRRKLLLLLHYYGVINNTVNNPSVLARLGLFVPVWRPCPPGLSALPARRPARLFAGCPARTRRAANSPTARALELLNVLSKFAPQIDIFADSVGSFDKELSVFLSRYLTKKCVT